MRKTGLLIIPLLLAVLFSSALGEGVLLNCGNGHSAQFNICCALSDGEQVFVQEYASRALYVYPTREHPGEALLWPDDRMTVGLFRRGEALYRLALEFDEAQDRIIAGLFGFSTDGGELSTRHVAAFDWSPYSYRDEYSDELLPRAIDGAVLGDAQLYILANDAGGSACLSAFDLSNGNRRAIPCPEGETPIALTSGGERLFVVTRADGEAAHSFEAIFQLEPDSGSYNFYALDAEKGTCETLFTLEGEAPRGHRLRRRAQSPGL